MPKADDPGRPGRRTSATRRTMFKVQRNLLTKFHVTDPGDFYSAQDFWQVPNVPDAPDSGQKQPPYYLFTQFPGQDAPAVPAHLGGHPERPAEPRRADLRVVRRRASRKLEVLELPDQTRISGPVQVHQQMTNNANIRQRAEPALLQPGAGAVRQPAVVAVRRRHALRRAGLREEQPAGRVPAVAEGAAVLRRRRLVRGAGQQHQRRHQAARRAGQDRPGRGAPHHRAGKRRPRRPPRLGLAYRLALGGGRQPAAHR